MQTKVRTYIFRLFIKLLSKIGIQQISGCQSYTISQSFETPQKVKMNCLISLFLLCFFVPFRIYNCIYLYAYSSITKYCVNVLSYILMSETYIWSFICSLLCSFSLVMHLCLKKLCFITSLYKPNNLARQHLFVRIHLTIKLETWLYRENLLPHFCLKHQHK